MFLYINQITWKKAAAQLFSTKKIAWAENQYIRMISEGSCDTEYWSNDAENSALITAIHLQYIQIENSFLICNNISHLYRFYCIFDQLNAALVSRRDFQKH